MPVAPKVASGPPIFDLKMVPKTAAMYLAGHLIFRQIKYCLQFHRQTLGSHSYF